MVDKDRFHSFEERYISGEIPWDDPLPPPELIALTEKLVPGRALDLGSGYGRTGIYLATKGWLVDGLEFVPQAVEEARLRARQAGVEQSVRFFVSDVTEIDVIHGPYDLAVDIGCMHTLEGPDLINYRAGLTRLLRPGAQYLLFAQLGRPEEVDTDGPRWIDEKKLRALFEDDFVLSHVEYGITNVPDRPSRRSAWFYYVYKV